MILGGVTKLPIPIERVLEGAKDIDTVLVLGYGKNGEFIAACSCADLNDAVFKAQNFIHKVFAGDYGKV